MENADEKKIDRRTFIQTAGAVAGSAIASTALSYDRILGANDRIALGHIRIGKRGSGLHQMASRLKDKYNVETVAVCDLWRTNRERAATRTTEYYGRAPKAVPHPDELRGAEAPSGGARAGAGGILGAGPGGPAPPRRGWGGGGPSPPFPPPRRSTR